MNYFLMGFIGVENWPFLNKDFY